MNNFVQVPLDGEPDRPRIKKALPRKRAAGLFVQENPNLGSGK
ncbi:hypothetical protein [Polaromonas sp.]